MRCFTKALLVTLACASLPVYASGWYAGVGVGAAHAQDANSNVQSAINTLAGAGISSAAGFDSGQSAFNIFGGYQFNRYVGAEAGWIDFGSYNLNGAFSTSGGSFTGSETDKISALWLAAVGILPINQTFAVFGKAGIANSQDKVSCTITGSTCSSQSDSGTNPMFGVGGEINTDQNIGLRIEYDQYDSIGNSQNEYTAGTFYQIALSALYRF